MTTASTLSRQLRLNVHSADGALLVGDEPLVHAQLVEEVHTREPSGWGGKQTIHYHTSHVGTSDTHQRVFTFVFEQMWKYIDKEIDKEIK